MSGGASHKGLVPLFRLVFPVIRKINSRLWTCRTEMGQFTTLGLFCLVVTKAEPFATLKITPLSGYSPQFPCSVL